MSEGKVWRAMKGCARNREQLSAFIDGNLAPEEVRAVEAHIAECASCSAALVDLRKVVGHLQGLEQVEPPPWFTQKVMARVRTLKSTSDGKGLFKWFFQPLYIKAPIGALATALLAVTTYFIFQGVIKDMPVERSVQDSERPQQIAVQEKATEQKRAPQKPQTASEGVVRERAVEKSVKTYAPGMKAEMPDYKAKRSMAAGASRSQSYDKAAAMQEEDSSPASKQYRPLMAEKVPVSFHIISDDPAAAGRQVVAAANEYHGSSIKTEIMGDKTIVRAELNVSWLPMFFERLRKAGAVQEKTAPVFSDVSSVKITVEIIQSK
jgi:anti-sigma factor RsiW